MGKEGGDDVDDGEDEGDDVDESTIKTFADPSLREPFGGLVETSLSHRGVILEAFGALLGLLGVFLGLFGGGRVLAPSWAHLGLHGSNRRKVRIKAPHRRQKNCLLGPSWGVIERLLGTVGAVIGAFFDPYWSSLGKYLG